MRDQVAAIEAREISGADLARAYLQRIDARDPGASGIHAIVSLDPGALARAAELDTRRGHHAPLQGAVILVKDNIDTQGIATTAGSLALARNAPGADAAAVRRLHAANALMLGKTNLSEWANFRSDHSTSGWSSVGGQTFNGAAPPYNPCGSSSGSAAAVAAGLASAAIGTETDGSITCPASVNGIVGFKPTVGLVSRAGIVPVSRSQDTAGPMTRTVQDAARLMSVLAGRDPADPATASIPAGMSLDFEGPLANATLRSKRLGVVDPHFDQDVRDLFNEERARLEAAGAILVDVALDLTSWEEDEFLVLKTEFKADLNTYLAAHARPGQAVTLADLIAFNEANAAKVMPYFGQEIFLAAQETRGLDDPGYLSAKQRARDAAGRNGIVAVMAANHLDALIAPTAAPAWKIDYRQGDPPVASASGPAAVAGYPHLTVPMGRVGGLPVRISFFAEAWSDGRVLALGHAYEQLPRSRALPVR